MSLAQIGEFAVDRVVELEFPAFVAKEFFPACTDASASSSAPTTSCS